LGFGLKLSGQHYATDSSRIGFVCEASLQSENPIRIGDLIIIDPGD
jgi:hypothetical protein